MTDDRIYRDEDSTMHREGDNHSERPSERDAKGRFKPGHSGNRAGRPITKDRALTDIELFREFRDAIMRPVTINGEKMPAIKGILLRQVNLALNADQRAIKEIHMLYKELTKMAEDLNPDAAREVKFVETFSREYPNVKEAEKSRRQAVKKLNAL